MIMCNNCVGVCVCVSVDLQPVYELDSLEYLEALELVTRRLQTRVNFCKAHLMMVTCFDVACRRR